MARRSRLTCEMDDEKLVEAVREFECLWKTGCKSPKGAKAAWKEVANKMGEGLLDEQCSHRWKALRDRFVRELKKTKAKSGDPGSPAVSPWPLFQVMDFLSDTVKHKTAISGFTPDEEQYSSTADENTEVRAPAQQSSVPPVRETIPRKRKRQESFLDEGDQALLSRLNKLQQHRDGEAAFGEHVAACLRQMNPRRRAMARIEIDKLLLNLQFPEDPYSSSPQPNDPYSTSNQVQ